MKHPPRAIPYYLILLVCCGWYFLSDLFLVVLVSVGLYIYVRWIQRMLISTNDFIYAMSHLNVQEYACIYEHKHTKFEFET